MKRFHVFIIIFIVFLSGCTADESIEEIQVSNYVGLVTSVYADSLPNKMYEGDRIYLQIQVENQGDYDVSEELYYLNVKGINPGAYEGLEEEDLVKSSGQGLLSLGDFGNDTIIRGQEVFTIGSTSFYYCNDIDNDLELNLHAKSCYDYGTTAEISGCFIESTSTAGGGVCTASEFKSVINSVSPVTVTEIAESVAGASAVRFRVKVENLGKGTVFDKYAKIGVEGEDSVFTSVATTLSKCDTLRPDQKNLVYIDSITLDGTPLILTYEGGVEEIKDTTLPRNRFRLDRNGVGRFSFMTETTGLEFVGNVEIELSYGYSETDIFSTTIQALSDFAPQQCSLSATDTPNGETEESQTTGRSGDTTFVVDRGL